MADVVKLNNSDVDVKAALDHVIPKLTGNPLMTDGQFLEISSGKIKTTGWRIPDNTVPSMSTGGGNKGTLTSLSRADHIHPTIISDSSTTDEARTWSTEKLTAEFANKADATGSTGDVIDYTGSGCAIRTKTPINDTDVANKLYIDNAATNLGACMFFNASTVLTVTSTPKSVNYNTSTVSGMTVDMTDDKIINIPKTGKYLVSFDAIYIPDSQTTVSSKLYKGVFLDTAIPGFSTSYAFPNPVVQRTVSVSRIISLVQGDRIALKIAATIVTNITHSSGGLTATWVGV